MDLVKGPHINSLRTKLKEFVEQLVLGQPMWVAGEWTRIHYKSQLTALANTTCSLYSTTQVKPVTTDARGLRLIVNSGECASHDTLMRAMEAWKAEPAQAALIKRLTSASTAGTRRRGMLVYVTTGLCGAAFAHANFLFFDFKRHLQIFYDPHTGMDLPVSFSRAFSEFQMIPGCKPISLDQASPLLFKDSLQEQFQQDFEADDCGVCGILTLLIAMICIRFQYYNPLHICQLLIQAYPQPNAREELIRQLISWYFAFKNAQTAEQIEPHIHKPSTIGCSTFSSSSGKLCSRPSCRGLGVFPVYCWQHRHIVKNTQARGKKCTTRQLPC